MNAEREWWDSLPEHDVHSNMSHVPARASLAEVDSLLAEVHGAVLDLGCGIGLLAAPFAITHPDCTVYALDFAPRLLGRVHGVNVRPVLGDGYTIPHAEVPPLAGAYSMRAFQHMPADVSAGYVKQVAELLEPGARFAYQVVRGDAPDSFLSHQCAPGEAESWAEDAGLWVALTTRSLLCAEWEWVVGVRT